MAVSSRGKKAKSATTPPHPVMRRGKSVKIPVHSVMEILGAIDKLGHSKTFRAAAKKNKAFMTVHSDTVNFVKGYLHSNDLHARNAVARKVVGACPGQDPYNCPYQQPE